MLCTQCSKKIKPVVALDIDGTLGDYHGHFEAFAISWLGVQASSSLQYDGAERYGEWFCRTFETDLATFRAVKLAFRMGGLKRFMPVIPDADLITECLRQDDFEIWLVTNRPYLKVDSIDPDTRFWLERNRITYDHLLYGPQKYARLIETVDPARIVAVVDDDRYQIADAEALGLEAIMVRTTYNRGCQFHNTAQSLYHLRSLVEMSLGRWRFRGNKVPATFEPEPAA